MANIYFVCRDCAEDGEAETPPARCPSCGSPRLVAHAELAELNIVHVDCDAFYATIEKRDRPELRDRPVIVGGAERGVVSTCCYIARQYGVHSAMPSVTAKRLCPDAVFIRPDMKKYAAVSATMRRMMNELTPLVEPLSIDEAFLDLGGTRKLHKATPAKTLVRFARAVEAELGVTVSVGLSHNKFLAKIASDLDKPRGFAVIGKAETLSFLAAKPISLIFGVGKVFAKTLAADGLTHIGQLQDLTPEDLARRYGEMGMRLGKLARGEDPRKVQSEHEIKSVSTETTFAADIADFEDLSTRLLSLCEQLSTRLKKKNLVGDTVTLKLKSSGFRLRTRARHLIMPTQLAHTLYETARPLLAREMDGTAFRLIGIGVSGLSLADGSDPVDLIEPGVARRAAAERAMDKVRDRFGTKAVIRGKLYRAPEKRPTVKTEKDSDR